MDRSFLDWPFFEDHHRDLAAALDDWCAANLPVDHGDVDAACRGLVAALGQGGWLRHSGGEALDVRTLCLIRETLARHDALADFAFAMQGLGMGAISLFGTPEQRAWLDRTRAGTAISAFALTEPGSGSDVAATTTTAEKVEGGYRLSGEKTYISNGGIADLYVIFARTGEAPGARGLSAFLMPAETAGLSIAERIEVIAPHPLATLRMEGAFLPDAALIGQPGQGFKLAMSVLDVFRPTVGAAALGMARRAFDEALARTASRRIQGEALASLQMVQGHLADMALKIDAAALLIYRAAWTKDRGASRISREAAMAKLYATEAAQEVIDMAVQLHGGDGVKHGVKVEELYREIRALRIYEGASDVQRLIIARSVMP
ncbi:MAG TPA: acyl-CoA dehydrogenase family protein [Paracoccus sp. (in: a-proteobacteria)]|uniref:acyl-CoA dehydrogenase family protein n=1 Tax=uncultured Paracoccus sp. TaxID=189685 RepID=UPI00261AB6C8|nr:acyl-CoA dehydrogenase family protein [uncultured Paracoccus sp.]HMQ39944.1 acyl-CoA dehydrogenase family protein [Paracoccus sp. (in: a-proteobacteria)]HMR35545.1 acyl-CoA dehydrogenase family protein [Paracoccus sp. (in: a-proteobacteria)]